MLRRAADGGSSWRRKRRRRPESYPWRVTRLPASRRRGTLAIIDNGLLVVVAIVAAVLAFKVLGFVFGALWFLFKVAAFVAFAYFVFRLLRSRAR